MEHYTQGNKESGVNKRYRGDKEVSDYVKKIENKYVTRLGGMFQYL